VGGKTGNALIVDIRYQGMHRQDEDVYPEKVGPQNTPRNEKAFALLLPQIKFETVDSQRTVDVALQDIRLIINDFR
jgi:hypothetical protein